MANALTVKPSQELIAENRVALWDQDRTHWEVDKQWKTTGGAFIAGDSENPDKTYVVADTAEVRDGIAKRRLELVSGAAKAEPAKSAEDDLEAFTNSQLKSLAEERGVDLGDATKKADIIAKLNAAAK